MITHDNQIENQKLQGCEPSYDDGELPPPLLGLNTNTSKAQTQLTIHLQEMLDKCVPEKIIKRP